MSLFVGNLAFVDFPNNLPGVKVGVLVGALVVGLCVGRRVGFWVGTRVVGCRVVGE